MVSGFMNKNRWLMTASYARDLSVPSRFRYRAAVVFEKAEQILKEGNQMWRAVLG
jgi:hypothetical protein